MEIVLCIILGMIISLGGFVSYLWYKKEMKPYMDGDDNE